ncbi:uncharacterized protein wu:fj19g03 [Triplophysa rosa]|uniref:uncharacterized protein wu:fj19g03 n=1 Tax=Triplophysa rosa TaxID=992332 RepID=UPI0025462906|nr:uncharacterized protein wu:fj19g03 [Triplophysa rosa]
MESVLSLKMLALVLLVSSMNEGRIVSKCELKTYLEAAQFQVMKAMGNSMTVEHLIARLVCNVENTSAFNTSLVTGIQINLEDLRPPFQSRPPPKQPEEPTAKEEDDEKMKEEQIIPVQPQKRPKGRPARSIPVDKVISSAVQGEKELFWMWQRDIFPKKPPAESSGSSSEESSEERGSGDSSEEELDDVISQNLFGIFQLSDRVACDSGSNRTLNLCGLECSALVDDDITDDVICLKTLVERRGKFSGFSPKKRFYAKMMAMLSVKECRSIIPSEYFAECS